MLPIFSPFILSVAISEGGEPRMSRYRSRMRLYELCKVSKRYRISSSSRRIPITELDSASQFHFILFHPIDSFLSPRLPNLMFQMRDKSESVHYCLKDKGRDLAVHTDASEEDGFI